MKNNFFLLLLILSFVLFSQNWLLCSYVDVKKKIILIEDVEHLNINAVNAILKILEDSNNKNIFFEIFFKKILIYLNFFKILGTKIKVVLSLIFNIIFMRKIFMIICFVNKE